MLLSQAETRYKRPLDKTEPLHAWVPRHAGNSINRYRVGNDGRTPEQRRCGRKWRRPAFEFGEQAMFRFVKTGGRKDDGEARSIIGVCVGDHARTGASLVLTPEGMIRGTGVHNILEVDRWNDTFLKTVKSLP